ncbi:DUF4833 domain-containing protein [Mucilaginibacter sp. dw_454]|uniref:DUF4833 domain-containing protein n=1 Tax=Mucilaginibacter sp. dw_454 TaxID=2720079 RepID=UPI001BD66433|nr:DUF4833 domain-containing protein [Mucilaginibacter sp. dw_454]
MRLSIILLFTTVCSFLQINQSRAQQILPPPYIDENKFAAPAENIQRLFYLQRLPNANTIIYELNAPNGRLDEDEPIHAYWIRYANKGEKEDLNYIQRKFAYGLTIKKLSNDQYDVRFVSYKKFQMLLMKANDGKYHIFATLAQKQMMVNRIFAKIEGGSFWVPNIVYVEFRGTDPNTGREIIERFKP